MDSAIIKIYSFPKVNIDSVLENIKLLYSYSPELLKSLMIIFITGIRVAKEERPMIVKVTSFN